MSCSRGARDAQEAQHEREGTDSNTFVRLAVWYRQYRQQSSRINSGDDYKQARRELLPRCPGRARSSTRKSRHFHRPNTIGCVADSHAFVRLAVWYRQYRQQHKTSCSYGAWDAQDAQRKEQALPRPDTTSTGPPHTTITVTNSNARCSAESVPTTTSKRRAVRTWQCGNHQVESRRQHQEKGASCHAWV